MLNNKILHVYRMFKKSELNMILMSVYYIGEIRHNLDIHKYDF